VVTFVHWLPYPWVKNPQYLLDRRFIKLGNYILEMLIIQLKTVIIPPII